MKISLTFLLVTLFAITILTSCEKERFGQTISTQTCWLGTMAIYDGYFFKYCQESCN